MAEMSCGACGKLVDDSEMYIYHEACAHFSHAKCDKGLSDTCAGCLRKAAPVQAAVRSDEPFPVKTAPPPAQELDERPSVWTGIFARVNEVSAGLRNRQTTPERSKDIWFLLKNHMPIQDLLNKDLGLRKVKEAGVTLAKFLDYGYDLGRLRAFPEINDPKNGVQALIGLGLTPELLLAQRTKLPMDELKAACGYTPRHLVERLGVGFDKTRGLVGRDGKPRNWNIGQLAYLGLDSADELFKAGLSKMSHWVALDAAPVDLKDLGWTEEHTQLLENDLVVEPRQLSFEPVSAPVAPARRHNPRMVPIPPRIQRAMRAKRAAQTSPTVRAPRLAWEQEIGLEYEEPLRPIPRYYEEEAEEEWQRDYQPPSVRFAPGAAATRSRNQQPIEQEAYPDVVVDGIPPADRARIAAQILGN